MEPVARASVFSAYIPVRSSSLDQMAEYFVSKLWLYIESCESYSS